jgi:hypothetical protein
VAYEQVLDIPVRRHVLTSERPFQDVLDGIYDGISQPDIGALFATLAASTSYDELSALVGQAQGSAGLIRFLHLDDDHVLALDPQARDQAGRRLVRLIAGHPVTMGQMTRHIAAAGSYAPVTILMQELAGGGTQVAYDTVASAIASVNPARAIGPMILAGQLTDWWAYLAAPLAGGAIAVALYDRFLRAGNLPA